MNRCNNAVFFIGLLVVVSTLQSNCIYAQDQYDCSFPTALDVSSQGDGSFLFRHSIHPVLKTINVEVEYRGAAWVGIAFSATPTMVGNVAVIGLPDDNTVLKHVLGGKVVTQVTELPSDTLTNTSITYDASTGSTILAFTKPLVETGETTISAGATNIVLMSYGSSNTLNYHAYRTIQMVTLNECVLAGTTPAPAVAPPPTPPVAAPTPTVAAAPTTTDAVVDLGNGRVERTMTLEKGALFLSILTDSVAETLTVTMIYAGIAWIAFALSDDVFMPNSNAVIAMPTGAAEGVPEKYDIGDGRTQSLITKVTDTARQTLTDATYTQNSTHTVMKFTKPFVDGSEIPVDITGMNNFLYSVGSGNQFGYHAKRLGFTLDLSATSASPIVSGTGSPNTKNLWMVHGIMMFIAWSILVPMAVGTALLRNFLPLPDGMWFQIHRILNIIAVSCTIVGFGIAVHNINTEQGSSAKHFSTYQHHTIGLVIFIFAIVQAFTGIFRPHLPKPVEATATTEHDAEDGTPKSIEPTELPKKSPSRIAFEIQHRLMGTVAMIMGWFNVDSGIGLYNMRFNGSDLVAGAWAITVAIVLLTLIMYVVDRLRSRKAE